MHALCNRFVLLLCCVFSLQVAFNYATREHFPKLEVVPVPPGEKTLAILSFGDKEFLFRIMAFILGNLGDTFGRSTPLYQYDLSRVYLWNTNLDTLDKKSNVLPNLAAYYFSRTQHKKDSRYMVNYLYEHSAPQVETKWWWLVQATYIAEHTLKDKDLAIKVALPLADAKTIPVWARQMPAFIYESRGEFDDALHIMETVMHHENEIPASELTFMRYFIDERLHKLDELDKESKKTLERQGPSQGKK